MGYLGLIPGLGRSPGGGYESPHTVFLPGESHGQRSLAGHSPEVAVRRDGSDFSTAGLVGARNTSGKVFIIVWD